MAQRKERLLSYCGKTTRFELVGLWLIALEANLQMNVEPFGGRLPFARTTKPRKQIMGIENEKAHEIFNGLLEKIDAEMPDRWSDDVQTAPQFVNNDQLREVSKPLLELSIDGLMAKAKVHWAEVTRKLRVSEVEAMPIGPLAETIKSPWPNTRYEEPLKAFLVVASPAQLLLLRSIGKRKAKTLIVLILSFGELLGSEDLGPENGEEPDQLTPGEPEDRVAHFWRRIRESISPTPMASERVYDLARKWGVKWPTATKAHHTLGEILGANSLRDFISSARTMGKKKIPSLAAILWRAWQEVEPDGPAGPPKTGLAVAEEEYSRIANETGAIGVVERAIEIAKVSNRESLVLFRRYGLGETTPMTLEEVGAEDDVTRERIRQIQVKAENKIRDNQLSRELLSLTLEKELPHLLQQLEASCGSALLKREDDLHRKLSPVHSFLIELTHGSIYDLLDFLVREKSLQKISNGWWLGNTLPSNAEQLARDLGALLRDEGRPLPLNVLADRSNVPIETIKTILIAAGLPVKLGYAFLGKLSAGQQRCLFALEVALSAGKWLWAELEFYNTAMAMDPARTGSLRLLLRDSECIPGVGIDISGPYVLVNPLAVRHAGRRPVRETASMLEADRDSEEREEVAWDAVGVDTLAGQVQELLEGIRIAKFEDLEEMFCESVMGAPGSLGPTLLSRPQFVRYAPGYWGIAGLSLEEPDIEQLCTAPNLIAYVRSRRLGGLDELFPFWNPEMEYHWCRWAERDTGEELYHSLLAICEPQQWSVAEPIRAQWESKKKRLGIDRLPPVQPSLDMAYIGFEQIYGLVHLAHQRGSIGPMTIPQFYGLRAADRKSYGTMALLGALGVLAPRADIESPWPTGDRVEEWLDTMSRLHYFHPLDASDRWRNLLQETVEELDSEEDFGWFSGRELKESFNRWKTERDGQ